ncbi:MarR family transcriptional regulator [Paenibacillus sp. S28]|jgi:DNA-binding MarR family transcriptional regulator|nr:MarR family transcriptional regulator [Paenibacillus sp. S28]
MLDTYFKECLYFTANRLSRIITKMAEDEFAPSGLNPTSAFLMLTVLEKDGISQKEIGQSLHLKPSTITRLIESLQAKGLLSSRQDGRMSLIYATDRGREMESQIHECWQKLRQRYNTILNSQDDELSLQLNEVSNRLESAE